MSSPYSNNLIYTSSITQLNGITNQRAHKNVRGIDNTLLKFSDMVASLTIMLRLRLETSDAASTA
jgi:hypothetical protein